MPQIMPDEPCSRTVCIMGCLSWTSSLPAARIPTPRARTGPVPCICSTMSWSTLSSWSSSCHTARDWTLREQRPGRPRCTRMQSEIRSATFLCSALTSLIGTFLMRKAIRCSTWPLDVITQEAIHMVGGSGDGFTKILDILCAAGSDLEARDFKGRTLLALTLSGSVSYNYAQLVPHLVSRGANLNTQDHNGNGVLHYMMQSHNVSSEHAEFLLSLGADPSMANHDGDTFLHCVAANIATVTGESGILIVRKLIQMGISPTIRNHKGQTPLHSLCSQVSQIYFNESVYPEATFVDLVLDTGLIAGLQIADRDGVLPIHLAATISESLVATLMSRGASTTAVTADGRNLLHIASTARQSNIIGLLLDHYAATGQTSIVNARCKNGRTPLHDACRSGRLETVTLLLAAGAEIDIADANNQTIFYACSAFTEEQRLWTFTNDSKNIFQTLLAGGVLSQDTTRPRVPTRTGKPERRSGLHVVESEHDTVDIGSIVRLLVTHGAKLDGGGREYRTSILDTAIRDGSDDVVVELERLRKKGLDLATRRPFESKYMRLRSDHLPALVDECINGHLSYYDLTHLILHGHSEEVIQALERNVETLRSKWDSASSALAEVLVIAARYGYTELFSRVGSLMSGSDWVNGARGALRAELIPYLLAASQRSLPNLEVIKVMVEKFHADVNVQFSVGAKMTPEVFFSSKTDANRQYKPDDTILHYLAKGGHWWHEGAIKYLLEHGANPNARDKQGKTPLCHAVCSRHLSPHRQTQLVKLFLEAGADPNIPAYCGFTPLAMAAHDNELVQLLIQHGARPSTEHPMELFSALANYNVKSLDSLLDMGLDCNTTVLSDAQPHWHTPRVRKTAGTPDYVLRPLDYISTEYFNDSYTRDNAIMMIRRLLERGADPYLPIDNKWLIIHAAFGHGGIIQPFLEMDNLDLERRDGEGRTLLLAAAFYRGGTNSYTYEISLLPSIEPRYKPRVYLEDDPSRARTLYERGADLTATDNKGNNVLHWLVQHQPGDKFQRMELEKTVALFLEKVPGLASQVNGEGKTPLDIATEKQHVWAIDILQSAAI
ncbi:ankyrin repeat-containing domain protein [Aspergillus californicus]